MSDTIDAWWFCRSGGDGVVRLPNGDGRVVRVGETLTGPLDCDGKTGPVVLCKRGFHASVRAIDALDYAPGPIVCRVRLSGTIVHGDDKCAASERTVLWMRDVSRELHVFAAEVALGALRDERAAGREPDPRSWAAVEAKRAWLGGRISDADLAAASDAAWAAASAAASAAWAASAAASAAAWDASAAASAAAWDASAAARDAAWAARAAASDAARGRQNTALEGLLMSALDNGKDGTR